LESHLGPTVRRLGESRLTKSSPTVASDEGDQLCGDFLAAPFPSSFNITIIIKAIVISRYKEFARAADGAPIRFFSVGETLKQGNSESGSDVQDQVAVVFCWGFFHFN
jgi:hypothetical protein